MAPLVGVATLRPFSALSSRWAPTRTDRPSTTRKLHYGDTFSVPAQQQQGGKVRSVAGSACRPSYKSESSPSPLGIRSSLLAGRCRLPAAPTGPLTPLIFRFRSPSRPSPRPSAAPPGRSDLSIQEPEGKEKGVNHERRGGFVVAEPGRAALHPGGAAAGGGLLAAVVGPHHHHRLVPRPLVPRARPPGRDGRAARRGQPPARRRGPLLRRPARAGPRRRQPSARR